jgi:hypothetical protein
MTTSSTTIARIWRGRTTGAIAGEYARYLLAHGLRPLVERALVSNPCYHSRFLYNGKS